MSPGADNFRYVGGSWFCILSVCLLYNQYNGILGLEDFSWHEDGLHQTLRKKYAKSMKTTPRSDTPVSITLVYDASLSCRVLVSFHLV